jgi:hypothetical protein
MLLRRFKLFDIHFILVLAIAFILFSYLVSRINYMLYLVQTLLEEFIHLGPNPLTTFMLALLLWKLNVGPTPLIPSCCRTL